MKHVPTFVALAAACVVAVVVGNVLMGNGVSGSDPRVFVWGLVMEGGMMILVLVGSHMALRESDAMLTEE